MLRLEDLEVYQMSEQIADMIWDICSSWDNFERDTVGKQVVRSADSIGANIAEGYGRFAFKENAHFCYYARGSYMETRHWLRRAKKRKLLTAEQVTKLGKLLQPFAPKLNAYIKSIKSEFNKEHRTNDK